MGIKLQTEEKRELGKERKISQGTLDFERKINETSSLGLTSAIATAQF